MPLRALRAAPPVYLPKPISIFMADALQALEKADFSHFRVGYAHTAMGPFTPRGTIEGLWKRGLADYASFGGVRAYSGYVYITNDGRKALAAWRASNPPIDADIAERF